MIYKYCLVVGQVISFIDSPPNADMPHVAILRVRKSIHNEAELYIYLNTVIRETSNAVRRLFNYCLQSPGRKLMVKSIVSRPGTPDFS